MNNKNKEIWFFNHYAHQPSLGGCIRYHNWAKEMINDGYNVTIFAASSFHDQYHENLIKDNSLYIEDVCDGIKYVYIKTRDYTGNGFKRIANMYEFYNRLLKMTKYFDKPDVIIARSPNPLECRSAILIAKKLHIPCISDIVDLWPQSIVEHMNVSSHNPIIALLYKYEKWVYMKSSAVIFSMEGGYDYIKDRKWDKKIPKEKVFYINMGVDMPLFDSNKEKYTVDTENMERDDIFKVVYCGSVRTANNVRQLCDGAKLIKEKGYDKIRFFIHGSGDLVDELTLYCKENSIDNLQFYGRIKKEEIPYLLTHSDLNVLNYHRVPLFKYGGSMNKMFEYFASGKPILSNSRFGYDLVEHYKCGYIMNGDSAEDYVEGILHFYNMDNDKKEDVGIHARKAAEDFTQPVLVNKLFDVFQYVFAKM